MQKYLITVLVLIISASCSMLEPYKNPIAQGNYFTPEETEKSKLTIFFDEDNKVSSWIIE